MKGKAGLLAGAAGVAIMMTTAAVAQTTTTTMTATKHRHHHHAAKVRTAATVAAANAGAESGGAPSGADSESGASLEERVRRLEEQLDAEHERQEAQRTRLSTLEQSVNDVQWSFDNSRPTVKTGDGRFSMALRVRFQVDEVNFFQDPKATTQFPDLSNGALVRRAFLGVEGKAFNDFWYEFRYNAGGGGSAETDPVLSLARVAYLGIPNFELNAGVIEPAFMFEGTVSSGQLMFMERPEIDNIAADSFGGGDGRRGVELRYQKADAFMPGDNLVLGFDFTGGKTGSSAGHGNTGDEQDQLIVHGNYRVWSDGISNVAFGGDYSRAFTGGIGGGGGTITLQDRPEFRVDGDRLISTGAILAKTADMWAFNGGANFENFYLGGEYAHFTVDREAVLGLKAVDHPEFSGWYVEGSWVLTGEPKSYTVSATNNEVGGFGAPKVASPFSLSGDSWGAFEVTARYSNTDLNWNERIPVLSSGLPGIAGGEERILMFGLNWYLNQNIKLQLNDGIVHVSKLSPPVVGVPPVQTGQDLNILGVRLQFTN